jgi:hypothetical protein
MPSKNEAPSSSPRTIKKYKSMKDRKVKEVMIKGGN